MSLNYLKKNSLYATSLMLYQKAPFFSIQYHLAAYRGSDRVYTSLFKILVHEIQRPCSSILGDRYELYLRKLFSGINHTTYLYQIDNQLFILMALKKLGFEDKYSVFLNQLVNALYMKIEKGEKIPSATFLELYREGTGIITIDLISMKLEERMADLQQVRFTREERSNFNLSALQFLYSFENLVPLYKIDERGKVVFQYRFEGQANSQGSSYQRRLSVSAIEPRKLSVLPPRLVHSEELSPRDSSDKFVPPLRLPTSLSSARDGTKRAAERFSESSITQQSCSLFFNHHLANHALFGAEVKGSHQRRYSDPLPMSPRDTALLFSNRQLLSPIIEVNTPRDDGDNTPVCGALFSKGDSPTTISDDPRITFSQ